MSEVRLWLQVSKPPYDNSWRSVSGILYTKTMATSFLPREGDRVILWGTEEEPDDGGPVWTVKGVHWNVKGIVNVGLEHMYVDPTENVRDQLTRDHISTPPRYQGASWYAESDGDPEAKLLTSGWTEY